MNNKITLSLLFVCFLFVAGCAKKTMVVLLPDDEGKVGRVSVETDVGSVDMTQAKQATIVAGRNSAPSKPQKLSDEKITQNFAAALASMPSQPQHFILYFKQGSIELTAESVKKVANIIEAIDLRDSREIDVVGHTDTAGNKQYNLVLSRKRAAAVTDLLLSNGVQKDHIESTSHGEENPLVKTADNVHEPRNRRVEVVVR